MPLTEDKLFQIYICLMENTESEQFKDNLVN